MPRVKRGTTSIKRRRRLLKRAKGYRFGRSKKEREARTALLHAGSHAFRHRREKKREARALWQININAGVRPLGLSYSRFIFLLKKKGSALDRKVLAHLAEKQPEIFQKIVRTVQED